MYRPFAAGIEVSTVVPVEQVQGKFQEERAEMSHIHVSVT
jgi:hypothetical protein